MIDKLRSELDTKGGNAEIEIYPGTSHGFAFAQRPAYDQPAAERHWERLFELFGDVFVEDRLHIADNRRNRHPTRLA